MHHVSSLLAPLNSENAPEQGLPHTLPCCTLACTCRGSSLLAPARSGSATLHTQDLTPDLMPKSRVRADPCAGLVFCPHAGALSACASMCGAEFLTSCVSACRSMCCPWARACSQSPWRKRYASPSTGARWSPSAPQVCTHFTSGISLHLHSSHVGHKLASADIPQWSQACTHTWACVCSTDTTRCALGCRGQAD